MKGVKFVFVLFLLLVYGCRSTKIAATSEAKMMSVKNIIKKYYDNGFHKQTINARLRIKYTGKSDLPNLTASLRVKKDEAIWISLSKLGFPLAKILITPTKVSYYEKINRTYFEGDFSMLSNWLGTDLDYEKIQNLILGEAILNLKKDNYTVGVDKNFYLLAPKKQVDLYSIFFVLNADNFKIKSQQVLETDTQKKLLIEYDDYKVVDGEQFPTTVSITATDNTNKATIDIAYKSVEFNEPVSFPFEIPDNYRPIALK
ncbi:MAG: DUF4292 domain-containing protein [Flavobacteriaceae bacterium]|nr:DUF4292 domain-containing protein [Flavobacteriaceae bacterium]